MLANGPLSPAPAPLGAAAATCARFTDLTARAGVVPALCALMLTLLQSLLACCRTARRTGLIPAHPSLPHVLVPGPGRHRGEAEDDSGALPPHEHARLARMLYVFGPAPRRGMRVIAPGIPVPRHLPPIRPPPFGAACPSSSLVQRPARIAPARL